MYILISRKRAWTSTVRSTLVHIVQRNSLYLSVRSLCMQVEVDPGIDTNPRSLYLCLCFSFLSVSLSLHTLSNVVVFLFDSVVLCFVWNRHTHTQISHTESTHVTDCIDSCIYSSLIYASIVLSLSNSCHIKHNWRNLLLTPALSTYLQIILIIIVILTMWCMCRVTSNVTLVTDHG
jgi:hypothetical protein